MARLSLFLLGLMLLVGSMAPAPAPDQAQRPKRMVPGNLVPDVLDSVVSIFTVGKSSVQICSGTFVQPTNATHGYILTAAHCCDPQSQFLMIISSRKAILNVSATCIHHPNYTQESFDTMDIALIEVTDILKLSEEAKGRARATNLTPFTTLPMEFEKKLPCGKDASVYGYGASDEFGDPAKQVRDLQSLQLEHVNCSSSDIMYVLRRDGITACVGDSGGPMIYHGKILGVMSFLMFDNGDSKPDQLCQRGSSNLVVKLFTAKDFIESTLGLESTTEAPEVVESSTSNFETSTSGSKLDLPEVDEFDNSID